MELEGYSWPACSKQPWLVDWGIASHVFVHCLALFYVCKPYSDNYEYTAVSTHTCLTALFPGLPGWAGTRKANPIWILLKQEMVSGSGISWAICKSASSSRQITVPAPHHSGFYRPDALPAAQPTASKHWRHVLSHEGWKKWVNPGNTVRVLSLWWRLYVTLSLVISHLPMMVVDPQISHTVSGLPSLDKYSYLVTTETSVVFV